MRRLHVRATAALTLLGVASGAPSAIAAPTLAECQNGLSATASGVVTNRLTPAEWAACQPLFEAALASEATRQMYHVDPSGLPRRLYSTTTDKLVSGAYRNYDARQLRDRSSDITYRTGERLAIRSDNAQLLQQAFPWLSPNGQTEVNLPTGTVDLLTAPSMGLPVLFVDPHTWIAHPSWETRGDTFLSCTEYAYKRHYTHSRFRDAVKACGEDPYCIVDVGYASGPPGIASRTMLDVNGNATSAQLATVSETIPKNLFVTASPYFLRDQTDVLRTGLYKFQQQAKSYGSASGGIAIMKPGPYRTCADYVTLPGDEDPATRADRVAKLEAIETVLRKRLHYRIGASAPLKPGVTYAETFADEWTFHDRMRTRHDAARMTIAEKRAIDERTAYLQELLATYQRMTELAVAWQPAGPGMPSLPGGYLDDPLDMYSPGGLVDILGATLDPTLRRWALGSLSGMRDSTEVAPALRSDVLTGKIAVLPFNPGDGSGGVLMSRSVVTPGIPVMAPAIIPAGIPQPGNGNATGGGVNNNPKLKLGTPVLVPVPVTVTDLASMPKLNVKVQKPNVPPGLANLCVSDDASKATATLEPKYQTRFEEVMKVQRQIAELLVKEYERGPDGCLSEASYKCDWTPALFASRFVEQVSKPRQDDMNECIAFTDGGNVAGLPAGKNKVSAFPGYVEEKKAEIEATLRAMPKAVPPNSTTGKPAIGDGDGGDFFRGDEDWFGAGYDYDMSWWLEPIHDYAKGTPGKAPLCSVNAGAKAHFHARAEVAKKILSFCGDAAAWASTGAKALGASSASAIGDVCNIRHRLSNLIVADAQIYTRPNAALTAVEGVYGADVILANERVYTVPQTSKTIPSLTGGEKILYDEVTPLSFDPIETERVSATVVVVVVPVTFQAFGEVHAGANVHTKAKQSLSCGDSSASLAFTAQLGFEPYARITAVGAAAVGVSGLQAGVRGRVNVLDAKLPIEGSVVASVDTAGNLSIAPVATAKLNVTALNGSLSAFAEVGSCPFCYVGEKEIFSFDGYEFPVDIWSFQPKPFQAAFLREDFFQKFQTTGAATGSGGL